MNNNNERMISRQSFHHARQQSQGSMGIYENATAAGLEILSRLVTDYGYSLLSAASTASMWEQGYRDGRVSEAALVLGAEIERKIESEIAHK